MFPRCLGVEDVLFSAAMFSGVFLGSGWIKRALTSSVD